MHIMLKVWGVSFLAPVTCPTCGAPLPAALVGASVTTCPWCNATLASPPDQVWAGRFERALSRAVRPAADHVCVGSRAYAVEGLLAQGEHGEVYLARRARACTERVVLKVPLDDEGERRLADEWSTLEGLRRSRAPGAEHFVQRLPRPVHRGPLSHAGSCRRRDVSVLRFPSGFVHTLDAVRARHAGALDPRHASWIWRRGLELLGFVHRSGFVHRDLRGEHLLVHGRDHGIVLVGWARAATGSDGGQDLRDLARLVRSLGPLPAPLDALSRRPAADAWTLAEEVAAASRVAFGPPAYVSLSL